MMLTLSIIWIDASRKAIGYRSNRVSSTDPEGSVRDLIVGDFVNWGAEARYLKRYFIGETEGFLD
jgi:Fe(3+) dicitrate transport protein